MTVRSRGELAMTGQDRLRERRIDNQCADARLSASI